MKKATHQQTKVHNRRLVLKTIYSQHQVSRAEVARLTRLTRTTISEVVAELIQEGLVAEIGQGPSERGKPPILLSVVDDARSLIGIDLANSEFRGGVVNLRGKIKHRLSLPVNNRNGEAALALVYELMDALVSTSDSSVLGIGIGTPGLVDAHRGRVCQAVNLEWQDLPLGELLQKRYGVPIYIANDSQAAALGEYTFGRYSDSSNLIVVKVGRGIGAGIVLNGQLHYGDSSGAGEIGHVTVLDNGELCLCGRFGCLETVASSRAIINRARAVAIHTPGSLLNQFAASPEAVTTDVVLQAFEAGDEATRQIIAEVGCYLGMAVAHLVSVLNVHRILIGGSVARFGEPLLVAIEQEMRRRALTALARETRVEGTSLGNDIVILGAAALLLAHELGLV